MVQIGIAEGDVLEGAITVEDVRQMHVPGNNVAGVSNKRRVRTHGFIQYFARNVWNKIVQRKCLMDPQA